MTDAAPSIMVGAAALLVAMLAVCVTAYVFLFSQLSSRVKEHGEERLPSERLQGRLGGVLAVLCVATVLLAVLDMYYAATGNPVWCLPYIYAEGYAYPSALFLLSLVDSVAMAAFSVAIVKHASLLARIAEDMLDERLEAAGYGGRKGRAADAGRADCEGGSESGAGVVGGGASAGRANTGTGVNPLNLIDIISAITGVGTTMKRVGSRRGMVRTGRSKAMRGDSRGNVERLVECRDLERVIGEYGQRSGGRPWYSNQIEKYAHDVWRGVVRQDEGDSHLSCRNIEDMSLARVDFSDADMSESRLVDCDFRGASFRRAILDRAEFRDCNLDGCDLRGASCGELAFADCAVEGIAFCSGNGRVDGKGSGVRIDEHTNLLGSSFRGSSLSSAVFGLSSGGYTDDASGVTVSADAHLGAGTGEATLFQMKWCGFQDARLRKASFRNTALEESSWTGCELSSSMLEKCACARSSFGGASLFDARILASDFRAADFTGALLSKAHIEHTDFNSANMQSTVFDNAVLEECSFTRAELSEALFTSGRLSGCRFGKAMGEKTRFVMSSIDSCHFDGACIPRSNCSECIMKESGFEFAVLSHGAFSGANLEACKFSYARMEQVVAREAMFCDCDFYGAFAEGADFTGSTIGGCDFRGAALKGALFSGTRIVDCDFANASGVESVDFRDAVLMRVSFSACDTSKMRRLLSRARALVGVNVNGRMLNG